MGLWQIISQNMEGKLIPENAAWDDGERCYPGDAGFSMVAIIAQAAGRLFNFMGTPDHAPEAV